VITGIGCVSPLGPDAESSWKAAVSGQSGVTAISRFDVSEYSVRIGAESPAEYDVGNLNPKEKRRMDRFVVLAVGAAHEAVHSAGLDTEVADLARWGVAIGSGIGGLDTLSKAIVQLHEDGPRRIPVFTIPMAICNMASGVVAIQHGLRGPNLCHTAACASGTQAIGEAARVIERGDADVMLAGGSEAPITGISVAGFAQMRALSTRNDDPARASRPFDVDRDGFVVGEGAAVLVLEEYEHAKARGADIRAHVLGFGMTADAASIAQPTEDAEGAQRCMALAIEDAELAVTDVDYLNAHATSTPQGDAAEARAIRALFGSHAQQLAVSATKSMTGHLLGAAGAVEAMFCVRALETGILPPTINLDQIDPECELDHVDGKARKTRIRVALSNSFGFGGTNAALIFGREEKA
jgi:3-oxoacyl-[acyl-carrier-protein] synthase II